MSMPTKDNLFRPALSRTETKADITDRVAREIIQEETNRRQTLTEKLRAARLVQEAIAAEVKPVAKPRVRKSRSAASYA